MSHLLSVPKLEKAPLREFMALVSKEPEWIVKGLIPGGAIALISGPRKLARKTYGAFTMFSAVACGKDVAGFKMALPPQEVLIVEEEGALAHTQARFRAVWRGNGFTKTEVETIQDNTHFFFRRGLRLNHVAWEKALLAYVKEFGIKMVMLDAFVYMIDGDENDTATQLRAVQTIQAIRALGVTVVVLLHLNNAYGLDKKADIDAQIRGAGAIKDCYDVHLALRRYREEEQFVRWHVRSRDGAPKAYLAKMEFETDPKTDITTSAKLELREDFGERSGAVNVELMLSYLNADTVYTKKELRDTWGLSPTKTKEVVEILVNDGALVAHGSRYKINQISEEYCK